MDDLWLRASKAALEKRLYAFATIIETTLKGTPRKAGAKMLVFEDGEIWGTIGGGRNEKAAIEACLEAMKTKRPSIQTYNYFGREGESVCGGQMKVFIEPIAPVEELVICGGGHIARPLSLMAKFLEFKVTIIDNRKSLVTSKNFPFVDRLIIDDHKQALKKIKFDSYVYAVIVTQGNEQDFMCLQALINKPLAYLGVISSKPKRIKFIKRLEDLGVKPESIKKVFMPMGVDIGAATPSEIAISILAQIVSIRRKDRIGTDKFKEIRHGKK